MDKGYTLLNNNIFSDNNLKPMEKLTLMCLIRYYNAKKGYSYPTIEQLKKDLGYSHKRYVISNISELEKKGYIIKKTVKRKNQYYILVGVQNVPQVKKEGGVQNVPQGGVQNVPQGGVQNVPPINTNTITKKNNIYIDFHFYCVEDLKMINLVKITEKELLELQNKFNKTILYRKIRELDEYLSNNPKKEYKNHYLTLFNWLDREKTSKISKQDIEKKYLD